jgi:hypothetical protein
MQLGNLSGAIANTNNHDHYLIQRTGEALDSLRSCSSKPTSLSLTNGFIGPMSRLDLSNIRF